MASAEITSYLKGLMNNYKVDKLADDVNAIEFEQNIKSMLGEVDYLSEGYESSDKQRDTSVAFHFGHNHDFGTFEVKGRMETDRHIKVVGNFLEFNRIKPDSIKGKKIIELGCWTGGVSMLLNAMGAKVVLVEEVKKYVNFLNYFKQAFNLKNFTVVHSSLYELAKEKKLYDGFDYVLLSGVLYHITDPVLALRIGFNMTKPYGKCLIETAGFANNQRLCEYWGTDRFGAGTKQDMNRQGWNWFYPSTAALKQMILDVGFQEAKIHGLTHGRIYAAGIKEEQVDMLRAGLSVRDIR